MEDESGREMWIEAGLKEIGRSGVEGVRVEVLAAHLGITKGGFYRRFKDRRALLDALLEMWRRGRIAAIEKQTELADERAGERLKSLIRLYSDAAASATVESVDAARLSNVAQLYRRLGWSAEEARARAVLLYAFIFGQSLIFLGPSLRKRASMTAACAEILIEVPAFDAEDST